MKQLKRKPLLLVLFLAIIISAYSNPAETKKDSTAIGEKINQAFIPVVGWMNQVFFWDPFASLGLYNPQLYDDSGKPMVDENGLPQKMRVPLIVVWLFAGALFFTIRMRFINFRGFGLSLKLVRGKLDVEEHQGGEVSHFQALTTALSATVGMGNIAGVAIAIAIGGPGATFWMITVGLLGMASKFTECTLGVKYREIDETGKVSGGPMYYLKKGLARRGYKKLGIVLSVLFSLMVMGGSFGGGNMIQANQSFAQLALLVPSLANYGFYYGLIIAALVGVVVIGGIKSIARVTEKIVPFMAILYVGTALVIIGMNITKVHEVFLLIWDGAFNVSAMKGGIIGVMILGIQRGAFSNEAGIGSAAIAHSAARTNIPVTEGLVALLEPFIDTVVICTMTALVIIFSGLYENPGHLSGTPLTSAAFATVFPWFPYLLLVAVILFAFSTMISWSYYGLNGFKFLFGRFFKNDKRRSLVYYSIFLICVVIGSSSQLDAVMDFSDMMILSMAFPNIVGLVMMSGEVSRDLKAYLSQLKVQRDK